MNCMQLGGHGLHHTCQHCRGADLEKADVEPETGANSETSKQAKEESDKDSFDPT